MVSLVLVSHSRALAEGVAALAREMGGEEVRIEAAGGLEDPPDAIGTDATRVMAALEKVRGPDGVLVLMDLGSALLSAEMAVEMAGGDGDVVLSEAPLVEGAVAAAARARGGATLAEVASEAVAALRMKAEQLGTGDDADAGGRPAAEGPSVRVTLDIPLGLHARPAARLSAVAGRFAARVTASAAGRGPADAKSLTALATLAARYGDELAIAAEGDDADAAIAAISELADTHFGDEPGRPAAPAAAPAASARPESPPRAGAVLAGIPAAGGVAVGPARPLAARPLVARAGRAAGAPDAERAALDGAVAAVRDDLARDRAAVARQAGADEAAIFDAHAQLLDDPELRAPAEAAITEGRDAPSAWAAAAVAAAERFRALDDPYLAQRAVDVEDVAGRVLARLEGDAGDEPAEGVVVADELTPGQAARLDRARVTGIAAARGGATSHAAILARALGIPAVVGLGPAVVPVAAGTPLIVDGDAGTVAVDPGEAALAVARARRARAVERHARLRARAAEPARTRDGTHIEVFANLGAPAEAAVAVANGAEGVGLLRTEFLFIDRQTPPDEDEQAAVYAQVAAALGGRPLVIRTLDAGADKPLPFLAQSPEANPFLGVRGLRLMLARPEFFRAQLGAIVRVAREHPVKLMFPMVTTLAEVRAAKALLAELRPPEGLEVGVMVEVPSVALQAERFARELDFFSAGTNDLAQYTMAAERGNAHLAALLDGPLPPVLRLVAAVVEGARAHGRWVGVCGELAGDADAAVLLAGLGVGELSMPASRIPEVKAALATVDLDAARAAAAAALDAEDAATARAAAVAARGPEDVAAAPDTERV